MKAKVRKGSEFLFSQGQSNNWKNLKDEMTVNFKFKGTYKDFRQKKNHLYLECTKGQVDIVFTGEVPYITFQSYEKDQLVFKLERL